MNIGEVSKASGVSAKMIRYYEATGLIPAPGRRESGYRHYGETDVHRLSFIRRARDLGFSVDFVRELLELWSNDARSNREVRELARRHVADLEAQAARLQGMIDTLQGLIVACTKRNGRPGCPIMDELEGTSTSPGPKT